MIYLIFIGYLISNLYYKYNIIECYYNKNSILNYLFPFGLSNINSLHSKNICLKYFTSLKTLIYYGYPKLYTDLNYLELRLSIDSTINYTNNIKHFKIKSSKNIIFNYINPNLIWLNINSNYIYSDILYLYNLRYLKLISKNKFIPLCSNLKVLITNQKIWHIYYTLKYLTIYSKEKSIDINNMYVLEKLVIHVNNSVININNCEYLTIIYINGNNNKILITNSNNVKLIYYKSCDNLEYSLDNYNQNIEMYEYMKLRN